MAIETIGNGLDRPAYPSQRIAGVRALKGLVLYGATLTFAALYTYFIVEISLASPGAPPKFDAALVSTAAALAGILGSAFALAVGTESRGTSSTPVGRKHQQRKLLAVIGQAMYADPRDTSSASWPKTFGIWVYALVAAAVALTYVLNQHETPPQIKALAVAFGGYVLALVTAEYKNGN